MTFRKLLVANRGEIAIRILRAASELGMRTVAVYSEDDASCLHRQRADEAHALRGRGARAYLDIEQLVALARELGCDAVHPGYGFLSESAPFAARCAELPVCFVGPRPETLSLLGDKTRARSFARELGVPVLAGTGGSTSLAEADAFFASLPSGRAMLIKAAFGGGGRGMRVVREQKELEEAYTRCRSEALAAFGNDAVYCEQFIERARHVEVQILGDRSGAVTELGERECSLQRNHQKLVEMAPAPALPPAVRERLSAWALELARAAHYEGLGTFEFLLDVTRSHEAVFIEANPRLQVEHTVTELVTGVDLVQTQLELAAGKSLSELGLLPNTPRPRGYAVQARINTEVIEESGRVRPSSGTLSVFEVPTGPGVRVDTLGYAGYATSTSFDPLLAKVIVHSGSGELGLTLARLERALSEFRIEGVATNLSFLRALVAEPGLASGELYTRFVEEHAERLVQAATKMSASSTQATAELDARDPLAVLTHGKSTAAPAAMPASNAPPAPAVPVLEGQEPILAPMSGIIVSVAVEAGEPVQRGQAVLVIEAMKMETVISAPASGTIAHLAVAAGDTITHGQLLATIESHDQAATGSAPEEEAMVDLDHIRPDLAEVYTRHAFGLDENRKDAVAKRHKLGRRTARENVGELVDAGTFTEYGSLVIAAQRRRRSVQELIERTPADGLVGGVGSVNGALFDQPSARTQCVVVSYDYTVLAGTQGTMNHSKKDRLFELAEQAQLPVVLFGEGGGGRPGDTDSMSVTGLTCMAFSLFGKLSGLVPLVGIASGRCFAGNAALLGCCDVVIATPDINLGMGGPAMIEGGGLGTYRPEEIGPRDVQLQNGVIDIAVQDDAEAVRVAKQYLSYFQGPLREHRALDQRLLRAIVPENRKRIYDVRKVIETLTDIDSVLELRKHFGAGMITALARIEGRPLGIIANNPAHLAGAIDSQNADKAARFMQLCDAFDLPILFLCDTPGIMVGPEAEKTGLVRHAARMFVTAASLSVPFFTIVLRKGYGLGAQLMAGGSFKVPFFIVSWPTGEFGAMGLEGAVKLGFRSELEAIADPAVRKSVFDKMVAAAYEQGKAVNVASAFELDDVIDPKDSRTWILNVLKSVPPSSPRTGKKRPCIDTW